MSKAILSDRKASAADVRAHAEHVRRIAEDIGFTDPRLRVDGTVVVHSERPGYRDVVVFSQHLSDLMGCYVHVITDDVPGAEEALPVVRPRRRWYPLWRAHCYTSRR